MRIFYILIFILLTPIVGYSSNIEKKDTAEMHSRASQLDKKGHASQLETNKTDSNSNFVAIKNVKRENVSAERMVIYSYIAFFLLVLAYILFINRKISLVSKRLSKLEELNKE